MNSIASLFYLSGIKCNNTWKHHSLMLWTHPPHLPLCHNSSFLAVYWLKWWKYELPMNYIPFKMLRWPKASCSVMLGSSYRGCATVFIPETIKKTKNTWNHLLQFCTRNLHMTRQPLLSNQNDMQRSLGQVLNYTSVVSEGPVIKIQ